MTFWATWLSFRSIMESAEGKLDPKLTYKITIEPVEKREAAFKLWHSYRDLYADTLGPVGREECKALLKKKTGSEDNVRLFAKLKLIDGQWEMTQVEFDVPSKEGSFETFYDGLAQDPAVYWLASLNEWTTDEIMESINRVKFELDSNGVDHDRLSGGV